ncbi:DUF362 domain-containing protein [Candidatus Latescibacterota bacterium]
MIKCDTSLCDVCSTCAGVCPVDAIIISRDTIHIDQEVCDICLACISVCPVGALKEDN